MSSSKKNILIPVAILAVLLIGGLFMFKSKPAGNSSTDESTALQKNEIAVSGTISCLPYHINVAGQECVKGIKGDDGKVYALNSPRGVENTMSEGTKVSAVGVYQSAVTNVDDSSVFKYDGVLVIRTLMRK